MTIHDRMFSDDLPSPPGNEAFYTIEEAARIARVSVSTLYSWVSRRQIIESVCRGRPLTFRSGVFEDEIFRMRNRLMPRPGPRRRR